MVGDILKHFNGAITYNDVMHKIPWNVLNRMLIDASNFEYEEQSSSEIGNNTKSNKKASQVALTDENADELLNIMLGKSKMK